MSKIVKVNYPIRVEKKRMSVFVENVVLDSSDQVIGVLYCDAFADHVVEVLNKENEEKDVGQ